MDVRSPEECFEDKEWRGVWLKMRWGHLVNSETEVYYWNDRDAEVDFVIQSGSKLMAIEVKSGRREQSLGFLEDVCEPPPSADCPNRRRRW